MPVTAKFSEEFYDRLGHRVADELVDWFNTVDATYRSEFRELFASHFGLFDAKLEQRVGELDAKLEQRVGELDAKLEQRFGQLDAKIEQRVAELRAEFRTTLAQTKTEMIRWMFVFWIGTLAPLVGLMLAIVR